jgi:hypothetical protein
MASALFFALVSGADWLIFGTVESATRESRNKN